MHAGESRKRRGDSRIHRRFRSFRKEAWLPPRDQLTLITKDFCEFSSRCTPKCTPITECLIGGFESRTSS